MNELDPRKKEAYEAAATDLERALGAVEDAGRFIRQVCATEGLREDLDDKVLDRLMALSNHTREVRELVTQNTGSEGLEETPNS